MAEETVIDSMNEELVGEPIPVEPSTDKREPVLNKYFKACIKGKFSDLHLKSDFPPAVRVKGVSGGRSKGALRPLTGGPLPHQFIYDGICELLKPKQRALFDDKGAIDIAWDVGVAGDSDRFRVNAFMQRGRVAMAARRVTREIRRFD